MAKASGNLQDSVLNQLRKENTEVEFFFLSGSTLKGTVRGFDNFTIIVKDENGKFHLIYKHAIAHIASPKAFAGRQVPRAEQQREQAAPQQENEPAPSESKKKTREPFNRIDLSQLKVSEEK